MMEEHDYSCLSRKIFDNYEDETRNAQPTSTFVSEEHESSTQVVLSVPVASDVSAQVREDRTVGDGSAAHQQKATASEHAALTLRDATSQGEEDEEHPPSRLPPAAAGSELGGGGSQAAEAADDAEVGEYYFETDHLALRGNVDYLALLKAIVVLEAQRTRAIQDLEKLMEAQDAALADPIRFVEKLQSNESLGLPKPQNIMNLPPIAWDHYLAAFSPMALNHTRRTRRKQQNISRATEIPPKSVATETLASDPVRTLFSPSMRTSGHSSQNSNEGRSGTYNQPWTAEEQKRLEALLVTYPEEEVESRRWEKIAQELGNRTRQQVASRVQKFFIKLTKAGLPVPGRTPNISNYTRRGHSHRHQRHNRFLFQPSTFFASYDPPVYMCDDDDTVSSCNVSTTGSTDGDNNIDKMDSLSDDDLLPQELKDSDEYKEILALTKLKREKVHTMGGPVQHLGYKCDRCECEPIIGTRWHCMDCSLEEVDICDDCVDCFYETATHTSSHRLQPIAVVTQKSYMDGDYTTFLPGNYNYLDPNYMPAT